MVEGSRGISALLATHKLNNDLVVLGNRGEVRTRSRRRPGSAIVGEGVALSTFDNLTTIDGDLSDLIVWGSG